MNITTPGPASGQIAGHESRLYRKAVELEAAFLAEMLEHSGLGDSGGAFSGGTGETQFASFLRREQATAMARAGGIGLAESLFRSMAGRTDGR